MEVLEQAAGAALHPAWLAVLLVWESRSEGCWHLLALRLISWVQAQRQRRVPAGPLCQPSPPWLRCRDYARLCCMANATDCETLPSTAQSKLNIRTHVCRIARECARRRCCSSSPRPHW